MVLSKSLICIATDTAEDVPTSHHWHSNFSSPQTRLEIVQHLKISSGCTLPIVRQSLKLRSPVIPPPSPRGMTVFFWPLGGSNKQAVKTELAYYQHPDITLSCLHIQQIWISITIHLDLCWFPAEKIFYRIFNLFLQLSEVSHFPDLCQSPMFCYTGGRALSVRQTKAIFSLSSLHYLVPRIHLSVLPLSWISC